MKYEEYEAAIKKMIAEPDTAETGALAILAEIKKDGEALDAATAGNAERDARIKTLQEEKMKLFLSQAGPAAETPEEEEGPKSFHDLLTEKMKEE